MNRAIKQKSQCFALSCSAISKLTDVKLQRTVAPAQ